MYDNNAERYSESNEAIVAAWVVYAAFILSLLVSSVV